MSAPQIIGWAHRPFGRLEQPSIESLLASMCSAALEDAGLSPADIDAVSVGVYNNVLAASCSGMSCPGPATGRGSAAPSARCSSALAGQEMVVHCD